MRTFTKCIAIALAFVMTMPAAVFAAGPRLPAGFDNMEIRNIIFLIPDGMDDNLVNMARWWIAYDRETHTADPNVWLHMDELASGRVRTWWGDPANNIIGPITDSAPSGTAFATGHKTLNQFIGVTPDERPAATILQAARHLGKGTGIVLTSNVQHATGAAFTSHTSNRNLNAVIAEQQVYGRIDVVLGGGYHWLTTGRQDGENLIDSLTERGVTVVHTRDDMLAVTEGPLWGLFAPVAMAYDIDKPMNHPHQPTLAEMTDQAIRLLSQNENGFFLMVEGSKIDWAAHKNEPVAAITDTVAFDEAIRVALEFARGRNDTMLLIATDHGCGGPTLGDRITGGADTPWTYDEDLIDVFFRIISGAQLTGEGLVERLNEDRSNVAQLVARYWGIYDLTAAEIATVVNAQGAWDTAIAFGYIMSPRAHIGWTTYGHTGNDGTLWSFLPGDARITGTMNNTDFTHIAARAWGVSMDELTGMLFNDAREIFESRGANVILVDEVPSSALMIVMRGDNVMIIPQNKDYVLFNGARVDFGGQVMVFNNDIFFVPQGVIDLLP